MLVLIMKLFVCWMLRNFCFGRMWLLVVWLVLVVLVLLVMWLVVWYVGFSLVCGKNWFGLYLYGVVIVLVGLLCLVLCWICLVVVWGSGWIVIVRFVSLLLDRRLLWYLVVGWVGLLKNWIVLVLLVLWFGVFVGVFSFSVVVVIGWVVVLLVVGIVIVVCWLLVLFSLLLWLVFVVVVLVIVCW